MRVEVIYCDKCGEEIPKVKKKDTFGIDMKKWCRAHEEKLAAENELIRWHH